MDFFTGGGDVVCEEERSKEEIRERGGDGFLDLFENIIQGYTSDSDGS